VEEVREEAQRMLGMTLITKQTGPAGKEVKRVYVEEGCRIARELYLGMVIDRATGRVTMMASTEGGMEIEEVAARSPEKILKEAVDPAVGFQGYQARNLAFGLGLVGPQVNKGVQFMTALYNAFVATDASLAEINPLVVTEDGDVMALDAKMNFDGNALYRHKDILALRDLDEENPRGVEASKN
ncbi:MAG: succinate--CoA ligase subunit beta, partial [Magnetococcales bacterium]|nr:succinate--CoA ligase subunit beta [Magnetococcales bacterium]